jgi:hypothetical protein
MSLIPRWQQQPILELDNLLRAIGIDDLDAPERCTAILEIDFAGPMDHMIQSLKSNLDDVVLGIVRDANEWQPFRL